MPFYKDTKTPPMTYWLDDAIHRNLIPADCVEIQQAEYAALSSPPPTLAQAQANQIAVLGTAYNVAISGNVNFTTAAGASKAFQGDANSVANLEKMLAAFRGSQTVPTGFYWLSADNTQVPFTYADMQGLAALMGSAGFAAFSHFQAQKAAVLAATTVAAVQAINF